MKIVKLIKNLQKEWSGLRTYKTFSKDLEKKKKKERDNKKINLK